MAGIDYDRIGVGYGKARHADPKIAAQIVAALGDAESVLNVGAGAGSYEPADRQVVAVEPSATMIAQRPAGAAAAVRSFDAVMAIFADHPGSKSYAVCLARSRRGRYRFHEIASMASTRRTGLTRTPTSTSRSGTASRSFTACRPAKSLKR